MMNEQILSEFFESLANMARLFFPDISCWDGRASDVRDAVVYGLATVDGFEYIASKDQRVGLEMNIATKKVTIVRGDSDDLLCLMRNANAILADIERRRG